MAKNGGSAITGYLIQMDDGLGGDFELYSITTNLNLIIPNLKAGRTYRLKYAGKNKVYDEENTFGESLRYSAVQKALIAVPPSPPVKLMQGTVLYRTALVFYWEEPIDKGGLPIDQYELKISIFSMKSESV